MLPSELMLARPRSVLIRPVRGLELISKRPRQDDDHPQLEEGEVVCGLAVTAGGDPPQRLQPSIGPLDRPAVASLRVTCLQPPPLAPPDLPRRRPGRDRLARPPRFADPRLDRPLAQCPLERRRGVAAVGPELARTDAGLGERVEQRDQVALLVLVAGREPDGERVAERVDG